MCSCTSSAAAATGSNWNDKPSSTAWSPTSSRRAEPMGWLEGDVALITGGGSGIGRAVALRYLAEGASVAVLERDAERLAQFTAATDAYSGRVLAIPGDVRRTDD